MARHSDPISPIRELGYPSARPESVFHHRDRRYVQIDGLRSLPDGLVTLGLLVVYLWGRRILGIVRAVFSMSLPAYHGCNRSLTILP